MKKVIISVVAIVMSVMAMATEEAYVRIRLTGASGSSSVVRLTQDDARTPEFESGYDSDKMMYQANSRSVLIYGFVGTQKCEDIVTNQLNGVKIGFVTNNVDDADYKLTFENVSGDVALKLYDAVEDSVINIVNNAEYEFDAASGRVDVENRFQIITQYNVTLNDSYLATFSAPQDVTIPAGLTAWYSVDGIENEELTLLQVSGKIPANTGVILYNGNGDKKNFSLAVTTGADAIATNLLKPASAWSSHSGTIYILHGHELWVYEGTEMKANKAYLQIEISGAPARIRLAFGQATAIDNVEVEAVKAEKFVENGQIFIRRGNEVFNLQGQIVK